MLLPSIADSPAVRAEDPANLVRIVLRGVRSVATQREPTGPGIPAYGAQLADERVAAVLTYIRNSRGNGASSVGTDRVASVRAKLAGRPD